MSNRIRDDAAGLATTVVTLAARTSLDTNAPVLGIVAATNRLVRSNGSLAAGRACAASVRAAAQRTLPRIPRMSRP